MFQSFHILLEIRHAGLRLEHCGLQCRRTLFQVAIELLVVDQSSHSSHARIDLGAYRVQMRRRLGGVLDSLLAAIENVVGFLEHIR